jgi:hypothetical protein
VNSDVAALLAGTVLAVGALAFVLYPLFVSAPATSRRGVGERPNPDESAILALREIEFDRATGKLSDTDYAELRKAYAGRALHELRETKRSTPKASEPNDPIEALVLAFRLTHRDCPTCGVRPEPDAIYCSTCGGYLDRACRNCSAPITEPGATFCSSCGAALARDRRGAFA